MLLYKNNLSRFFMVSILFFALISILGCSKKDSSDDINLSDTNSTIKNNETNTTLIKNPHPIFKDFNVGFGGSSSFGFVPDPQLWSSNELIWINATDLILDETIANNTSYKKIKLFNPDAFIALQQKLQSTRFLVYWFSKGWKENWYSKIKIQEAIDHGIVPVFVYWYFGDELLTMMPTSQEQTAYLQDAQRLSNFLRDLNGTKLFIMEPEFNKDKVLESETNQHAFATIIKNAIDTIKTNTKDILFSLAMTDTGNRGFFDVLESCGYANCALGDQKRWSEPNIIYQDLSQSLDFISFQEMIGQFSRNPKNPGTLQSPIPIQYSDEQIGIDYLAQRISNFTQFLYQKYNKPVFLPYITIATATWSDDNNNNVVENEEVNGSGWTIKAEQTYRQVNDLKSTLQRNGLFGFALMALFDNPLHAKGEYQYFMQNEYHLGVITTSADYRNDDKAPYGDLRFKGEILDLVFEE